jgi:hypothetical protein
MSCALVNLSCVFDLQHQNLSKNQLKNLIVSEQDKLRREHRSAQQPAVTGDVLITTPAAPTPAPRPSVPVAAEQPAQRTSSMSKSIADELPKPRYDLGAKKGTDEAKADALHARVRSNSNPRPAASVSATVVPSLLNRNGDTDPRKEGQGLSALYVANEDKLVTQSRSSSRVDVEEDMERAPAKSARTASGAGGDRERHYKYYGDGNEEERSARREERKPLDVDDLIARLDFNKRIKNHDASSHQSAAPNSPNRNRNSLSDVDANEHVRVTAPMPYSPSRTNKHAMQLLQDTDTSAKALSSLLHQNEAEPTISRTSLSPSKQAELYVNSANASSNVQEIPKPSKGIAFVSAVPVTYYSGFGETTAAKGKSVVKLSEDNYSSEIDARPLVANLSQALDDYRANYSGPKKDNYSKNIYDTGRADSSAASIRAEEKPVALGRVVSSEVGNKIETSAPRYNGDSGGPSRSFDIFGDEDNANNHHASQDASAKSSAKVAEDKAAKNKKFTVPKSPKFSKMSWERRSSLGPDNSSGTGAPPPPPLGAGDSSQSGTSARSTSASRRAWGGSSAPPPEAERPPAATKPVPNYMRPIGDSSRRSSRG